MPTITFHKYQATGNDFIMIDNRERVFPKDDNILIGKLCDRKFGIGSDGLILIEAHPDTDFSMIFFNPDGSQSLCGNGSRCAVHFAKSIGIINGTETAFMAYDGVHSATIKDNLVDISMNDVQYVSSLDDGIFVDTGSPHFVRFVEDVDQVDIIPEGQAIRYSEEYKPSGTNVNFVQQLGEQQIFVRTYERGVEAETLSCGTGVVGAAIAASTIGIKSPVEVMTKGGKLSVEYSQKEKGSFENIRLCGLAEMVYVGSIDI